MAKGKKSTSFKFDIGERVIVKLSKTDKRLWFREKIKGRKILGSAKQKYYVITGFGDPVQESFVSREVIRQVKKKIVPKKKPKKSTAKKPKTLLMRIFG